jgi:molecular chaperone GrpE
MATEQDEEKNAAATPEEGTQQSANDEASNDVEKLKQEVEAYKDKYLRLYSEFDNFRRRTAKEKVDFLKTANKDLILALLPVIDDFERSAKAFDKDKTTVEQLKQGNDLIYHKLKMIMEKEGLKAIEHTVGKPFDVEMHEAVTQFPAPSEDLKGKVVDELEKGYTLGDKVIRFSKVVVGQ